MKRLAIFVEGYTEQVFIEKLVNEIGGAHNVRIEKRKIRGGSTCRRTMPLVGTLEPDTGQQFYVLIVDCGSDESVKSRILEEYDGLAKKNYQHIIGIRDVRPIARADIPKLEKHLPMKLKTIPITVVFILSIMEVEAWFMAEHSHFLKIDPSLTCAHIKDKLGFDPSAEDMQEREQAARDLDCVYQLAGKRYEKGNNPITVESLSYEFLCFEMPEQYAYFNNLTELLSKFFSVNDGI